MTKGGWAATLGGWAATLGGWATTLGGWAATLGGPYPQTVLARDVRPRGGPTCPPVSIGPIGHLAD